VDEPTANFVAQSLRTDIVNSELFVVVDRANMDKILAEQKFQQTGCTKQDCAVQMGKVLNVYKIIAGTVSKLQDTYIINVSVVDVQTGKIEAAATDHASSFDALPDAIDRLAQRLLSNYVP
jgi:TolB-like protein